MIVLPSKAAPQYERLIEGGVIVADVPCVRSTYNLRGLSPESHCPECGQEILLSIYGPVRIGQLGGGLTWLRHVARGCKIAGIWYFASLPLAMPVICTLLLPTVGIALVCLWLCVYVLACWWTTSPGERKEGTRTETALRLATRWTSVAALGCVASLPAARLIAAAVVCATVLLEFAETFGSAARLAGSRRDAAPGSAGSHASAGR